MTRGETVALTLIRGYRAALAPLVGPVCRFEPSCSAYAEESIRTFGVVRGSAMAALRLLRCHPFSRGGYDPVPTRSSGAPITGRQLER